MHAVVGLEIEEAAVTDARRNAFQNHVSNATFVSGKAEHTLPQTIDSLISSSDPISMPTLCLSLFAILDPPRSGLPRSVTQTLRACTTLRRVIYIACNPHSMGFRDNISWLTKSASQPHKKKRKEINGEPFRVVRARAIDMFPHTQHCELVLLLER